MSEKEGIPAVSPDVKEVAVVSALLAPALAVVAVVELKRAEARRGREGTAGRRNEFKEDIELALSGD